MCFIVSIKILCHECYVIVLELVLRKISCGQLYIDIFHFDVEIFWLLNKYGQWRNVFRLPHVLDNRTSHNHYLTNLNFFIFFQPTFNERHTSCIEGICCSVLPLPLDDAWSCQMFCVISLFSIFHTAFFIERSIAIQCFLSYLYLKLYFFIVVFLKLRLTFNVYI